MIEKFQGKYRFLSNFWPAQVDILLWSYEPLERTARLVSFPTAEHAYQASKSAYQRDWVAINQCKTPGQAKRLGRKISIREDWEKEKVRLFSMTEVVRAKFTQNEDLGEMLVATGDQELQEGNTWGDKYWGVCDGEGENHLGKILMLIRTELNK